MIDLAVVALILCFIIGLISSALLTAALYLYQLSRQSAPEATEAEVTIARTKAVDAVAAEAADYAAFNLKVPTKTSAGGDGDAAVNEPIDEDGSTATTSYSSCERCSQGRIPLNYPQQMQQQVFSSWTEDAATGTAGSAGLYTCEVCGSCCAGDNEKPGKTYRPLDTASIDAELSIDNSLVRFRRCRTGVGAYFFQRNNDETCLTAVSAVSTTLTLPAESDCLYNLRFCTTNGESHSANLTQCSDCRLVLRFELTKFSNKNTGYDEPALFLNRLKQRRDEKIGQLCVDEIDSWMVAVLSDSASKEQTIAYSGMARKLVQIARQPDHQLVLQLCLQGQQTQCLEPHSIMRDCDALNPDQSTHGDNPGMASPLTTEQLLLKQQQQKQRQLRRKRRRMQQRQRGEAVAAGSDQNNCEDGGEVWNGGDSECSNSAGNSLQSDTKSSLTGNQSPLSMGSMRRAVRWPITQMESLMETSSSSTSSAAASGPSSPIGGGAQGGGGSDGRGDVTIRLEDPQPFALDNNEAEAQQAEARQATLN